MMFNFSNALLARLRPRAPHRPDTALRRRRGGLFFLALFMGLSGILRLGEGVGIAVAETAKTGAPTGTPAEVAQTCEPDSGAQAMLVALREREKRLIDQEKKAAEREQSLAVARKEIGRAHV